MATVTWYKAPVHTDLGRPQNSGMAFLQEPDSKAYSPKETIGEKIFSYTAMTGLRADKTEGWEVVRINEAGKISGIAQRRA